MLDRSPFLLGPLALSLAVLIPAAAHADVRIEERSTSLNSTVKRWTAIKADKRSIVSRAETTGVLYNAGARYGAYVEIARPDLDKIFDIDPQERSYRELTAEQFSRVLQKGIQAPRNANEQPLRTLYRSETTAIEVAPTGKEKRIAGYDAQEVLARVVIGAQNLVSGNKFTFTFDQEIWITKDPALLKEIHGFEDAYTEHFGSAATLAQARLLAGEWNDAFVTHLRAVNDRVRALGGFPLSTTTTVTEEAVAQAKGEKGSTRKFVVATNEVTHIALESVPDSEFDVPAGYVNSDTKVAVAPRPAAPAPVPAPAVVAKNDPPLTPRVETAPPVVAKNDPPAAPAPVVAKNDPPAPAARPVAPAPVIAKNPPSTPVTPSSQPGVAAAPVKDPAPAQVAARPEPTPVTPQAPPASDLVAAAAKAAPQPDVNPPVKVTPGAQAAATPARPAAPEPVPVTAPPTNVIVPGVAVAQGPVAQPRSTTDRKHPRVGPVPVVVDGSSPSLVIPALGVFSSGPAPAVRASSLVTIDEPETAHEKSKKKKKK